MSDTEHDSDPKRTGSTTTTSTSSSFATPTSATSKRASERDEKKKRKEQQQQETDQLRMQIQQLQQQRETDQKIINDMKQQGVQVKQEENSSDGQGNKISDGDGSGAGMVATTTADDGGSDEDGEYHTDNESSDDDIEVDMADATDVKNIKQKKKIVVVKKEDIIKKPIVLPRIPKSLQNFGGESGSSVRNWLQHFEATRVPLGWDDRVSIAICAMHLTDRAQQWYQEEGVSGPASQSWKWFKQALLTRFTPTINQLFIPKYTRDLAQKSNEKSVDFLDRVRVELRDLGVDDEAWVVRVFSSGLHDWITEPLTMLVGDSHQISAKDLLDHCTRIELSKSIRHGTHFDGYKRNNNHGVNVNMGYQKYNNHNKEIMALYKAMLRLVVW